MRQAKLLSPQVNNFILLFGNFRFSRHRISIFENHYGTLLWPHAAAFDNFSIPTVKFTITMLRFNTVLNTNQYSYRCCFFVIWKIEPHIFTNVTYSWTCIYKSTNYRHLQEISPINLSCDTSVTS